MTEEEISAAAEGAADIAVKELGEMFEVIVKKHNLGKHVVTQPAIVCVGLALEDIQHQAFTLGILSGMRLLMKLMTESEKGK